MLRRVKRNEADAELEQRVRRDLAFLFEEYGATITSNTVEPYGNSQVTVAVGSLEFRFAINTRGANYQISVGPRNGHGVWELLHVALAAATGEDAASLIIPFSYSDDPFATRLHGTDASSCRAAASLEPD